MKLDLDMLRWEITVRGHGLDVDGVSATVNGVDAGEVVKAVEALVDDPGKDALRGLMGAVAELLLPQVVRQAADRMSDEEVEALVGAAEEAERDHGLVNLVQRFKTARDARRAAGRDGKVTWEGNAADDLNRVLER